MSAGQHRIARRGLFRGYLDAQNIAMMDRHESDERPESQFFVLTGLANGPDDRSERADGSDRHAVVAEGDVEVHVAGGCDTTLRAGTDRPELSVAAVEAQSHRHGCNPFAETHSTILGPLHILRDTVTRYHQQLTPRETV